MFTLGLYKQGNAVYSKTSTLIEAKERANEELKHNGYRCAVVCDKGDASEIIKYSHGDWREITKEDYRYINSLL